MFSSYVRLVVFFFFKQKTAYEMRISDWSSDVCSSDLFVREGASIAPAALAQKIEDCCFAYDEDCISDSWRTQQRDFERDARKFANEIGRASCRERVCQYV